MTNPSKKYTFWWDWSIHMLLRNIWIDQSICSWESIPAKSAIFSKLCLQKEQFSVKLTYCILLDWKHHFFNRNVDPIIFGIWNGKNSLFITQGTLQFPCASQFFPIHGLAVVVKIKSIIRGFAAHDGFYFHHAC